MSVVPVASDSIHGAGVAEDDPGGHATVGGQGMQEDNELAPPDGLYVPAGHKLQNGVAELLLQVPGKQA